MTPQLCNFEQSKALKALGYNWRCYDFFSAKGTELNCGYLIDNSDILDTSALRPTIQDAIRFFRVEKGYFGYIIPEDSEHGPNIYLVYAGPIKDIDFVGDCDTYDSAENALLNRLIEISNQEKA